MSIREHETSPDPADEFVSSLSQSRQNDDVQAAPPTQDELLRMAGESLPPPGWLPLRRYPRVEIDQVGDWWWHRMQMTGLGMILALVYILVRTCWAHLFG